MVDKTEVQGDFSAEEMEQFESMAQDAPAKEPSDEAGQEGLQAEAEDVKSDAQAKQEEPAKVEKAEDADKTRDEKGRFVPHQALHAEREEHKKTRQTLDQVQQQMAVLNDRWNTLLQVQQQPQKQEAEDPEPDPNVDIFAHHQWLARQFQKTQQQLQERSSQEQKSAQEWEAYIRAQNEERAVWDTWNQSVGQYAQQNPDFNNAAQWLSEYRDKQLQGYARVDQNYQNPQVRNQQINQELKQIIQVARQQGISPAEAVYGIAQSYGYQTKPVEAAPQSKEPTPAEKIAKVAKAQEASKTIANAGGKSGGDEIGIDQVLQMSDKEFEKWGRENQFKLQQLLGGA